MHLAVCIFYWNKSNVILFNSKICRADEKIHHDGDVDVFCQIQVLIETKMVVMGD